MIVELQCLPHMNGANSILVMFHVLNFITDHRSSKTCMETVAFQKLRNTSLHVLTRSYNTAWEDFTVK